MQTFLPYPSFARSAACLDVKRLGKQRVEAYQILKALLDPSYGWQKHPAVKMWRGYETALSAYGLAICDEWLSRGYKDSLRPYFLIFFFFNSFSDVPPWLGSRVFHASHRAALLFKNPSHYLQFGWEEKPGSLPYVWPV